MDSGSLLVEAWEIVPVGLLMLVGGAIAIPSGVRHMTSRRDLRQLAGNLSGLVLRLAVYVIAIWLVHDWIGLRPSLGW